MTNRAEPWPHHSSHAHRFPLLCATLLLLLTIALTTTAITAHAAPAPSPLNICMYGQQGYSRAIMRAGAAVTSTTVRNNTLSMVLPYTSPTNALLGFITQFLSYAAPFTCQASLGDVTAQSTYSLSLLSTWLQQPMISTLVNTNALADRALHRWVIRAAPNENAYIDAFFRFAMSNGWKRVAVLGTAEESGMAAARYALSASAKLPSLSVSSFIVPYDSATFTAFTLNVLRGLQASGVYVIYLQVYRSMITLLLNALSTMKMIGAPYTYFAGSMLCDNMFGSTFAVGLVCLGPSIPGNHRPRVVTPLSWVNFLYSLGSSATFPGVSPFYTDYEAPFLITAALNALSSNASTANSFSGEALLSALGQVDVVGPISGVRYKFDPVTGDLLETFIDIFNLQPTANGSARITRIGAYNSLTQTIFLAAPIVWADGSRNVPLDYVPVITNRALVSLRLTVSPIVLSTGLCLLSLWTGQLLINIAVLRKRHNSRRHSSRPHTVTPSLLTRLLMLRVRSENKWVAIAALVWGVCVTSAVHLLTITQASVDKITQRFDTMHTILYPLVPIGCAWFAFLVALSEINPSKLSKKRSALEARQKRTLNELLAHIIETRHAVDDDHTLVGRLFSSCGLSVRPENESSSSTHRKRRSLPGNPCLSVVRMIREILATVSPRMHIAGVFLTLSVVISFHLTMNALSMPCTTSIKVSGAIGSAIFLLPTCTSFLLFAFHDTGSSRQQWATLVMTLMMLAHRALDVDLYSFYFNQDMYDDGSWMNNTLDHSASLMACAAIAGAVMFLFTWLTLDANQMSRSAIELLLLEAQRGCLSLQKSVNEEKLICRGYIERQKTFVQDIALILHVRPSMHALGLAGSLINLPGTGLTTRNGDTIGAPFGFDQDDDGGLGGGAISPRAQDDMSDPQQQQQQPGSMPLGLMQVKAENTLFRTMRSIHALHLETETASAAQRTMPLESILGHAVTLEIFKDYLLQPQNKGSSGIEMVTLWLDIQRFKTVDDSALRAELASAIVDEYKSLLASHFPNQARELVVHRRPIGVHGFDTTAQAVLARLKKDKQYTQFQSTPEFRLCILLLGLRSASAAAIGDQATPATSGPIALTSQRTLTSPHMSRSGPTATAWDEVHADAPDIADE